MKDSVTLDGQQAAFLNEEGILHCKASEFAEAVDCWKIAANSGNASAMFGLGVMYDTGHGTSQDKHIAEHWLTLAAELGHQNSLRYLQSEYASEIHAEFFGRREAPNFAFMPLVEFEGYEWLILERRNNSCLCLTKDIISIRPYHDRQELITWQDSTLRKWLNESFIGSFHTNARKLILLTHTEELNDKIFLLSADEAQRYLGGSDCTKRKALVKMSKPQFAECEALYGHNYTKLNGQCLGWWLRDSGSSMDRAARINCDGKIRLHGRSVNSRIEGVRPACWIEFAQEG